VTGPAAGCLPAVAGEAEIWTFAAPVAASYPARVLPAGEEKLLAATFRYLDAHAVERLPGGADGRGGPVDVPLACRYALARLARGEADAAIGAFKAIANVAAPTGALPARADLRARAAAGAMPAAEAAAGCAILLREMLVRAAADELHLCAAVPEAWLAKPLSVANAPTRFGPVSFSAALSEDGKTLTVEASVLARPAPKAVVVHLPVGALAAKSARAGAGRGEIVGRAVRVVGWKGKARLQIELVKTQAEPPR
jgi:hypothetical protein